MATYLLPSMVVIHSGIGPVRELLVRYLNKEINYYKPITVTKKKTLKVTGDVFSLAFKWLSDIYLESRM